MGNRKPLIIFLVVSIVIAGSFLAAPLLINWYLNQNAERILSDMITRTNDFAGHDVNFGDIEIDYDYRGTYLHLKEVEIFPGERISGKDMIRFNLSFDAASLTGFSWMDFLLNNSIQLDSAYIENVNLESETPPLEELEEGEGRQNTPEGKDYNNISVKHLRVNKVSFENRDSYTDSTRLSIHDLFVFADDFILTKEDRRSRDAIFSVKSIEGYMAQAVFHLNDYRNSVSAKDFSFNTTEKTMGIENVAFQNKLDKYEYINEFEKETNWMELKNGKLQVEGMEFQSYFRHGQIVADSLLLAGPELEVFRDKRKTEDTTRRPKMIHEVLKEMPKQINISEIIIDDAYISYEERPDTKAPRAGKIYFDQVNGRISRFTNFETLLNEDDKMEVKAKANLLGKGAIDLEVTYFLNDESGKFLMNGKVGRMDLRELNPMIEPATRVALKNGTLNDLFFNISANDIEGTGQVIAKYQDLEIEILDKNYQNNQNILRKIGAFLANKIVIPSFNPTKEGELKKGEVYFQREKHKFIFNYWWELVLSGLKSTVTGDTEADMRKNSAD
ncbi:MAG: hypothetical protein WD398_13385 [Cyclobacteriaceae bacterium]